MTDPMRTLSTILLATAAGFAAAHDGKLTFAPVLEKATPAVVNIRVANDPTRNPLFNDPFFRRFIPEQSGPRPAGSGVVIDARKGHVVTNHHVIQGADRIIVELQDRREFTAELAGSDPATDIALLKIDAEDLTALPLGDSDQLSVGDFVIAIGNPFNLGQTVTSGIVSALGRTVFEGPTNYEDFIQTDAAINRGNSGGALVDLDGRLVGINSAIFTPSGANAGIGFAVPANIVKLVAGQLLEYGDVRRGQLGVRILAMTQDIADAMELSKPEGVVVVEVVEGSSAETAGIEPGDVIASMNGEEVTDPSDLRTRVGLTEVGDEVELAIIREGKRKTLQATVGHTPKVTLAGAESTPKLAGAELRDLPSDHELHGRIRGVEIVDVARNSRAWYEGLRAGDIILRVNRRPVASVREFKEAVAGGEPLTLDIRRGNRRLFAVVR